MKAKAEILINANELRGLMSKNRHTQEFLANKLGISRNSLHKKLKGKITFKHEEFDAIRSIYGVGVCFFLVD